MRRKKGGKTKKELTTEGGDHYRGEKSWHTFLYLLKSRGEFRRIKKYCGCGICRRKEIPRSRAWG